MFPDGIDDAGSVAVRNDPGVGHPVSDPVATLFRISGVHAGQVHPHPHLTGTGLGRGHLTDLEHLRCWSLPLIPSCEHDLPLTRSG